MAFTYVADQASYTDLNFLRLRSGDTVSSYPLFTDAEMNALITKCTSGGVVDFDKAVGILEEVKSVDPIRMMESRKATSGGVGLVDEMSNAAQRSEVFSD